MYFIEFLGFQYFDFNITKTGVIPVHIQVTEQFKDFEQYIKKYVKIPVSKI